jgi:hypothetical protein
MLSMHDRMSPGQHWYDFRLLEPGYPGMDQRNGGILELQ